MNPVDAEHLRAQPGEAPAKKEDPSKRGEADDRGEIQRLREEARGKRLEYLRSLNKDLPEMVERWKAQFPRVESIHVLGTLYIYRGMNRGEYIALMQQGQDKIKNDEMVASKCTLHPKTEQLAWVELPAGLPTTLADLILTASGFGAEDAVPIRL